MPRIYMKLFNVSMSKKHYVTRHLVIHALYYITFRFLQTFPYMKLVKALMLLKSSPAFIQLNIKITQNDYLQQVQSRALFPCGLEARSYREIEHYVSLFIFFFQLEKQFITGRENPNPFKHA